jgi:hypothetical protein
MATTILTIDAGVIARIKDEAGKLSASDRQRCIGSARSEYEKLRPRQQVTALAGASVYDYATSGLAGFEDGFSHILRVEGPVLVGNYVPPVLDPYFYSIVRTPAGLFLRFRPWAPATGQTYNVTVTTRHTLDGTTSTVLAPDEEALMDLAAAHCCDALAAFYSQSTDGSIAADTVDHSGKAELYRSLKGTYRAAYDAKVKWPDTCPGYRWVERA